MSHQAAQRVRRATAEHVGSKVYLPLQSEKQRRIPSLDPHIVINILESHLAETRVLQAWQTSVDSGALERRFQKIHIPQSAIVRGKYHWGLLKNEIPKIMVYVNGEDERREQDWYNQNRREEAIKWAHYWQLPGRNELNIPHLAGAFEPTAMSVGPYDYKSGPPPPVEVGPQPTFWKSAPSESIGHGLVTGGELHTLSVSQVLGWDVFGKGSAPRP
ncbi:hypothetical protein EDB84DRAFT_1447598 [Lactarius hengduanensis]|nr:hypothetical protein EDB84DRAFT_1447598 [Lactarius hengduanensis]